MKRDLEMQSDENARLQAYVTTLQAKNGNVQAIIDESDSLRQKIRDLEDTIDQSAESQ